MPRLVTILAILATLPGCRQKDHSPPPPSDGEADAERCQAPDLGIWLPDRDCILQVDERYYLDVSPEDMKVFIEKNDLRPLDEWPLLATTGFRGYRPPESILALHVNDPLFGDTVAAAITSGYGYTAVYYNRTHRYLVIQP
jgi:hypothetical protein